MLNYSVCLDAVYNGRNFIEAMESINKLGYKNFEFWSWWNKDMESIIDAKNRLGMTMSGMCTKMVSLVDSSKREEYLDGLRESIELAKKADCKNLITQVGNEIDASREEQKESLIEGLKQAGEILKGTGITLLVEPLNTKIDHKGYFLSSSEETFEIIKAVSSENVKVLYDIYHQQITEGDILGTVLNNMDLISHFHCAGVPGRHEIHKSEVNYKYIIGEIEKTGYKGFFGLEYFTTEEAEKGLEFLR